MVPVTADQRDHHRHTAGGTAPDDVLRGAALEQQRVDQDVERDGAHRQQPRQQVGRPPQPDERRRRLSASPNTSALRVGTAARANGRRAVRFIILSMSASATQFSVLAPPAASMPPTRVLRISSGSTLPRWASSIAGIAVTSSSSITRGFVSARYAEHSARGLGSARRARERSRNNSSGRSSAQLLLRTMVDRTACSACTAGSIRSESAAA